MIDLYAAGTSNGLRARMALEETGLAYRLHPIALDRGENRTPQFLAMNPDGQIPVIVDHDGPGGKPLTVSQSTAILLYCAEKSGTLMPREGAARAAMWEALANASTDITPTLGALFAVVRAKEPHAPTAEMLRSRLRQYLKVWDDKLAGQRHAAGVEMTIADISLFAGYARIQGLNPELLEGMTHLARWGRQMAARPAMQRAVRF